MTTKTTTKYRKPLILLLCTILVYSCAGGSFLGPGISAETAMGHISATDVVTPIGEEVQPLATTVPQVWNVMTRITMTRGDIMNASATISGTSSAQLHKYDCVDITPSRLDSIVSEDWENSQEFYICFSSNYFSEGTRLVDICFNVPTTVTSPLSTVTANVDFTFATDGSIVSDGMSCTTVLIGDVNLDGVINSNDSLLALQFATDPEDYPLTEAQQLSADVDRNGSIEAGDAMYMNQYAVQTLGSFWDEDQITLPTVHTEEIVHQGWYRIKNAQTGQYITGGNTDSTKYQATVGTTTDTSQACLKFKINQAQNNNAAAGCFSLRCLSFPDSSLYLKLDSNYALTLSSTQGEYVTYSGHWYLLPQSDGSFRMVNRAVPQQALTDFGYDKTSSPKCKMGYAEPGSYWVLEPVVTISYFYDEGYLERNANAQSDLTDRQQEIADILKYVFGVNPVIEAPGSSATQSFADECTAGINANCSCSGRTNTSCIANHDETNYTLVHHKNANSMLRQWRYSITTANRPKINVLFSGHKICYVNDDGEHKTMSNTYQLGGLAYPTDRTAMVYDYGATILETDHLAPLHEISHCLGAFGDSGLADTVHNVTNTLGRCVMSYNWDEEYLLTQWEYGGTYCSNLFCDDCTAQIATYLSTF